MKGSQNLFRVIACFACVTSLVTAHSGGRIVGGEEADIEDHPYQLALFLDEITYRCGAAILAKHWVITAARCLLDTTNENVNPERLGLGTDGTKAAVLSVESYVVHPRSNLELNLFDISLLRTKEVMDESKQLVLPGRNEAISHGTEAVVTGWGHDVSSPFKILIHEQSI